MHLRLLSLWFLLVAGLMPLCLNAEEAVTVQLNGNKHSLNHLMQFTLGNPEDTLDDIRLLPESSWQYRNTFRRQVLGKEQAVFWARVKIQSKLPKGNKHVLRVDYPHHEEIRFFQLTDNIQIQSFTVGSGHSYDNRPIRQRTFWFPIEESFGSHHFVYMRFDTRSPVMLPSDILPYSEAVEEENLQSIWVGIFFGMTIILVLYNFFLGLSLKDKSHLLFSLYLFSAAILQFALMGYGEQYLWRHSPGTSESVLTFAIPFTVFWGTIFSIIFVDLYKFGSKSDKHLAHTLLFVSAVLCIISFHAAYHMLIMVSSILSVLGLALGAYMGIKVWRQGNHSARLFILAWLSHCVFLLWFLLDLLGLVMASELGSQGFILGFILEFIFIMLASSDKINKERELRILSQTKLLDMQVAMNSELDSMVKERTLALEKANHKLHDISIRDGLTQLHNRRHFDQVYKKIFADSYNSQHPVAVMMIDIDFFKKINDTYGHTFGDLCLITAANIIKQSVTMDDAITARYGGEEFVVVLPKTTENRARKIGEHIRREFESTEVEQDGNTISMTVSIGIACDIPEHPDRSEELLQAADIHLYLSKKQGRNQVTYRVKDEIGSPLSSE